MVDFPKPLMAVLLMTVEAGVDAAVLVPESGDSRKVKIGLHYLEVVVAL